MSHIESSEYNYKSLLICSFVVRINHRIHHYIHIITVFYSLTFLSLYTMHGFNDSKQYDTL
jgi:hypothetical protein